MHLWQQILRSLHSYLGWYAYLLASFWCNLWFLLILTNCSVYGTLFVRVNYQALQKFAPRALCTNSVEFDDKKKLIPVVITANFGQTRFWWISQYWPEMRVRVVFCTLRCSIFSPLCTHNKLAECAAGLAPVGMAASHAWAHVSAIYKKLMTGGLGTTIFGHVCYWVNTKFVATYVANKFM